MGSPRRTLTMLALLAIAIAALLALWMWRYPMALVHAEFTRQRLSADLSLHDAQAAGHRWVYALREADRADAPTLVMVHGFTGSKENWYPLAKRLGGRYRLVIPDLPGWGASERKPGADYGYVAQSQRLARFIEMVARRPGSEVVLLGHSMGGGIAALTAANHPRSVDRVGLFDAAGVRFKDNRFGAAVLDGDNPFAVQDQASLQRYIDTVFHDEASKPMIPWPASSALIRWRMAQAPFEQAVLDRIGRSDERFLPGDAASRIDQPALLLWCRQDAVIDASALDLYAARMPQAQEVLLEDCGHMSIIEKPDAAAAAIVSPDRARNPKMKTTMSATMKTAALAVATLLALTACGDREAEAQAAAAAQAAATEAAANTLAREYDNAVVAQNWELARVHGAALIAQYPDSEAVAKMESGYEDIKARGEAARETRRMQALWDYAQVAADGGTQRSAAITSKDPVDVDGSGDKPVQLVFRDHPEWERSGYLVLQAGDFRCAGGCKVKVIADGAAPKSMDAWRPDTDEAIAMFITDQKALWKLLRKTQVVEIEFPVKAGGTRKAVFETGGLDGAQMPGWD